MQQDILDAPATEEPYISANLEITPSRAVYGFCWGEIHLDLVRCSLVPNTTDLVQTRSREP